MDTQTLTYVAAFFAVFAAPCLALIIEIQAHKKTKRLMDALERSADLVDTSNGFLMERIENSTTLLNTLQYASKAYRKAILDEKVARTKRMKLEQKQPIIDALEEASLALADAQYKAEEFLN